MLSRRVIGAIRIALVLLLCLSLAGCGWLWGHDISDQERYAQPKTKSSKLPAPVSNADASTTDQSTLPPPLPPGTKLNFAECVEYALINSPYLVKSRMDIEVKKITEDDRWWEMFPELTLNSYVVYNVTKRNLNTSYDKNGYGKHQYNFSLSTGTYNPWVAYYAHDAAKLMTNIAVLGHLKVLNESVRVLALAFLQMDAARQTEDYLRQLSQLADEYVAFSQSQMQSGLATLLDVKIAEQERDMARLELDRIHEQLVLLEIKVKGLIGVPEEQSVGLDFADASGQLFANMGTPRIDLDDVYREDPDLRISKISRDLSDYSIILAWTQYVPQLSMGVRAPDPTSNDGEEAKKQDYFFQIGIRMPIWDWGARYRGVEKSEIAKRQSLAQEQVTRLDLAEKWRNARSSLRMSEADYKLSRSADVLAAMNLRKDELSYESGNLAYLRLLSSKRSWIRSEIRTVQTNIAYLSSLLQVEHMSGELGKRFLNIQGLPEAGGEQPGQTPGDAAAPAAKQPDKAQSADVKTDEPGQDTTVQGSE